jgi:hypothetical protein
MATHYLKPKDPNFRVVHKRIRSDRRAYPHLKDCIGSLDGTHIRALIAGEKSIRYIGRAGIPSQNMLAICDREVWNQLLQWRSSIKCTHRCEM